MSLQSSVYVFPNDGGQAPIQISCEELLLQREELPTSFILFDYELTTESSSLPLTFEDTMLTLALQESSVNSMDCRSTGDGLDQVGGTEFAFAISAEPLDAIDEVHGGCVVKGNGTEGGVCTAMKGNLTFWYNPSFEQSMDDAVRGMKRSIKTVMAEKKLDNTSGIVRATYIGTRLGIDSESTPVFPTNRANEKSLTEVVPDDIDLTSFGVLFTVVAALLSFLSIATCAWRKARVKSNEESVEKHDTSDLPSPTKTIDSSFSCETVHVQSPGLSDEADGPSKFETGLATVSCESQENACDKFELLYLSP